MNDTWIAVFITITDHMHSGTEIPAQDISLSSVEVQVKSTYLTTNLYNYSDVASNGSSPVTDRQ